MKCGFAMTVSSSDGISSESVLLDMSGMAVLPNLGAIYGMITF